jgi:hypothetical protein
MNSKISSTLISVKLLLFICFHIGHYSSLFLHQKVSLNYNFTLVFSLYFLGTEIFSHEDKFLFNLCCGVISLWTVVPCCCYSFGIIQILSVGKVVILSSVHGSQDVLSVLLSSRLDEGGAMIEEARQTT